MSTAAIASAKELASIGCQVFPLAPKRKVPLKGSHSFYDASSDLSQIDKWAVQNPRCNWGLATGQRSGVVVLEVDLRRSGDKTLAKLEAENGRLPKTVTVISPSGGPHFYLKRTEPTPSKMDPFGPGIELKADKNLVVVAGSIGRNGTRYRYEHGASPGACEIAPLPGWIVDSVSEYSEAISDSSDFSESSEYSDYSETMDTESIIRMTLPTKAGERNDCVMKLARGLRFNHRSKDIGPASLRKVVEQWHSLASPVIATKSFSETWRDFLHAYDTARFPLGLNLVDMAAGKVDPDDLPESAAGYDDEPTRKLIGLCWSLASINGGEKFFLSSHDAAPRIGINQMQTWRLLRMLEVDGVIKCMDRGNAHRAGRYKWIGGEENR